MASESNLDVLIGDDARVAYWRACAEALDEPGPVAVPWRAPFSPEKSGRDHCPAADFRAPWSKILLSSRKLLTFECLGRKPIFVAEKIFIQLKRSKNNLLRDPNNGLDSCSEVAKRSTPYTCKGLDPPCLCAGEQHAHTSVPVGGFS